MSDRLMSDRVGILLDELREKNRRIAILEVKLLIAQLEAVSSHYLSLGPEEGREFEVIMEQFDMEINHE